MYAVNSEIIRNSVAASGLAFIVGNKEEYQTANKKTDEFKVNDYLCSYEMIRAILYWYSNVVRDFMP